MSTSVRSQSSGFATLSLRTKGSDQVRWRALRPGGGGRGAPTRNGTGAAPLESVVSRAPDLADALAGIPSERMSPAAKQFAKALYRANLTSLSYLLRRMES